MVRVASLQPLQVFEQLESPSAHRAAGRAAAHRGARRWISFQGGAWGRRIRPPHGGHAVFEHDAQSVSHQCVVVDQVNVAHAAVDLHVSCSTTVPPSARAALTGQVGADGRGTLAHAHQAQVARAGRVMSVCPGCPGRCPRRAARRWPASPSSETFTWLAPGHGARALAMASRAIMKTGELHRVGPAHTADAAAAELKPRRCRPRPLGRRRRAARCRSQRPGPASSSTRWSHVTQHVPHLGDRVVEQRADTLAQAVRCWQRPRIGSRSACSRATSR